MKKLLLMTTALVLAFAISGPAGATIVLDGWTINATGLDGIAGSVGVIDDIDSITYNGMVHVETFDTNGNILPDAGEQAQIDGILNATSFVKEDGTTQVVGNGSLLNWELTFDFSIDALFTSIDGQDANFSHLGVTNSTGTLSVYVDNLANNPPGVTANQATGDGFQDGELIATFNVLAGDGGVYDFTTGNGSDDGTFALSWAKAGVLFDSNGVDLSTYNLANDIVLLAITGSDFDSTFNDNYDAFQRPTPTAWPNGFNGNYTDWGTPVQFFAQNDGSANLGATPEPSTIILLGVGLLGVAGFGRKKYLKV